MSNVELPKGDRSGVEGHDDTAGSPQYAPASAAMPSDALPVPGHGNQERLSRRGSNSEQLQRSASNASADGAAKGEDRRKAGSFQEGPPRRQRRHGPAAEESQQQSDSANAARAAVKDSHKKGRAALPARSTGHQPPRDQIHVADGTALWENQPQREGEQQYSGNRKQLNQRRHGQHPPQQQYEQQQWQYQQQREQFHQAQPYEQEFQKDVSGHQQQRASPRVRRWPSSEGQARKDATQETRFHTSPDDGCTFASAQSPLVSILQQQHREKPSPAHTTEAEVHFIGELEAGQGFCSSGGLFCEFSFEAGKYWLSLCRAAEKTHQTQTAYGSVGDLYVWNHPIDLHYALSSVVGWPRCRLSIWKLTPFGRVENVSYGTVTLPTTAGHYEFTCQTWTPLGTYSEEFAGRLLGRRTELDSLDVLDSKIGDRMKLTTRSSGQVLFILDVIVRNFEYHGLSSCSQYPAANTGTTICLGFTRPELPLSLNRKGSKAGGGGADDQQQKPGFRSLGTNSSYSKLSEGGYVVGAPSGADQLFPAPRRGLSQALCPVSPRGGEANKKKE